MAHALPISPSFWEQVQSQQPPTCPVEQQPANTGQTDWTRLIHNGIRVILVAPLCARIFLAIKSWVQRRTNVLERAAVEAVARDNAHRYERARARHHLRAEPMALDVYVRNYVASGRCRYARNLTRFAGDAGIITNRQAGQRIRAIVAQEPEN